MQPFSYSTANSVADASKETGNAGSMALGGGTCVIDLMKLYVLNPDQLVDVRKIGPGLIEDKGSTVLIGGTVSNSAVAWHPLIKQEFPVLSQALLSGASPQLRNVATVAGNVMQKTRCYYYRDTAARCNKREPGSGCDAIEGYNRIHAILGGSANCIATHPSDMCVALAMLDSIVHVSGKNGLREIPFTELHVVPGDHPEIETVLKPGEVITAVEIRKSPLARRSHYLKVRDRQSFAFALTSAAVALDTNAGGITAARLALGGVATKPWRATEAEALLQGKSANRQSFLAAAEAALAKARPHKFNGFKVALAKRTIVRAYEELLSKA